MANWFISPSGNDATGNGSQGLPWKTLAALANNPTLGPGDFNYLRGGSYLNPSASIVKSGNSGAKITWQNFNSEPAVLTYPTDTNGQIFTIMNKSYNRFVGLVFDHCQTTRVFNIWDSNTAVDFNAVPSRTIGIEVANCRFLFCGMYGAASHAMVNASYAQDVLIDNCYFTDCFGQMVYNGSCYRTIFQNSQVDRIKGALYTWTPLIMSSAIWTGPGLGPNSRVGNGTIVQDCFFKDALLSADPTERCIGVRFDANSANGIVRRNRCRGYRLGFYPEAGVEACVFSENIAWLCSTAGLNTASTAVHGGINNIFRNNVSYKNNQGINVRNTCSTLYENNICMDNNRCEIITTAQAGTFPSAPTSRPNTFRNNLYFKTAGGNLNKWQMPLTSGGSDSPIDTTNPDLTFAQWNAAVAPPTSTTTGEPGSKSANPLFVNVIFDSEDFHLQAGSPAKGVGFGGVDMGAYPTATDTIAPAAPTGFRKVA